MKESIEDHKDMNGISIQIGDTLDVGDGTTVKVVKTDDYETGYGFDFEDKEGFRIWNPYFAVETMKII